MRRTVDLSACVNMLDGLVVRCIVVPFGSVAWRVVWIDDAVVVVGVLARALDAHEQGLALGDGDAHRMVAIAGVARFEGSGRIHALIDAVCASDAADRLHGFVDGVVAGDGYNPYASVRAEGEWWMVVLSCAWLRVPLLVVVGGRRR